MNKELIYTITRSYSQNLQHENSGGNRFEKSDFFSSHSQSFFEELTSGALEDASKILYSRAKQDVEKAINQKKAEFRIANSSKGKEEAKLIADLEIQGDDDENKRSLN